MKVFQIMCECCGFCINVHTSGNEDGVKNVQVRYENRCPIMIFSQVCIPIRAPPKTLHRGWCVRLRASDACNLKRYCVPRWRRSPALIFFFGCRGAQGGWLTETLLVCMCCEWL